MRKGARQAAAKLAMGTRLLPVVGKGRALVLRYHRVAGTAGGARPPLAVSPEEFGAHVKFLQARCRVVPLSEIADAVVGGQPVPAGAVALTFDCGYEDNFSEAFYQLARQQIPATFFIAAGWVETKSVLWWDRLHEYLRQAAAEEVEPAGVEALPQPVRELLAQAGRLRPGAVERLEDALIQAVRGLRLAPEETELLVEQVAATVGADEVGSERYLPMNWEQIRLLREGGMEIGSYTVSHARLAAVYAERAYEELVFSKTAIESKIGEPIRFVAYPEGSFNADVADLAEEAGYGAGFLADGGAVRAGDRRFALSRIDVSTGEWRGPRGGLSRQVFGLYLRQQARSQPAVADASNGEEP